MCKVNNFLCCCQLETGGLIIGWWNVILSVLAIFGLITLLSLEVVEGNTNPDSGVVGSFIGEWMLRISSTDLNKFTQFFSALVITYSIMLLYFFFVLIAAYMLIQGTRQVSSIFFNRVIKTKRILFHSEIIPKWFCSWSWWPSAWSYNSCKS